MNETHVYLDSSQELVADVFKGDNEREERIWVCVRINTTERATKWLGCWSRDSGKIDDREVVDFLRSLAHDASNCLKAGRTGPFLNDHLFYSGWQTWGPGRPNQLPYSPEDQPLNNIQSEIL